MGYIKNNLKKVDYSLLGTVLLLFAFGLLMVYSSTAYNKEWDMMRMQLLGGCIGMFVGCICAALMDYHWGMNRWVQVVLTVGSAMALIAVRFVGKEVNGSARWFAIGGLQIQPSEIVKIVIIILMAALLAEFNHKLTERKWSAFLLSHLGIMAPAIILMGLIAIENLTTAIICCAIIGGLMLIVSPQTKRLLILAGIGAVALVLIFIWGGEGYRMQRIDIWLHPEMAPLGAGLQPLNSRYALASAGLFGKGLGNSFQKLGALPEAHNDYIFSIVCEELGIVGGLIVIILFVVLVKQMIRIAIRAQDLLGSLIVLGVALHIGFQAAINIAVVTGLMPPTGVPLPFISYGGTSAVFLMIEIWIVQCVAIRGKQKR